jgi:hypothetical protein
MAAFSACGTVWVVITLAAHNGMHPLLASGTLGLLTVVGWVITLIAGPIAAIQLWRLKEAGRPAGIALFGYGLLYYVAGVGIRSSGTAAFPILFAALSFAIPLAVLLSRRARFALS